MMRKILFCLISICLSLSVEAYDFQIGDLCYSITSTTDRTVSVEACSTSLSGDVVIPSTVTSNDVDFIVNYIASNGFAECYNIKTVTIPNSVKGIGELGFGWCWYLNTIILDNPRSSFAQGYNALGFDWRAFTTVRIINANEKNLLNNGVGLLKSSQLPTHDLYINDEKVVDYQVVEGVETINTCFRNCNSIETLSMPNSVKTIVDDACYYCTSLKTITLSSELESIGRNAFAECPELRTIYAKSVVPTSIDSSTFPNGAYMFATLYVPKGTLYAYKNADIWANFSNIVEMDYDDVVLEPVTSITISPNAYELYQIGQTVQLVGTVLPENASNKVLKWESSNESVATVSNNGLVTAVGEGNATIIAMTTDGTNLFAGCSISVSIQATSINLNSSFLTLDVNETTQLTATVYPSNASNQTVTWESSNTAVATVSNSGLVTAKALGSATITATTTDGSNLSASCVVTVKQNVVLATSISLNKSNAELTEGDSMQLTATVLPSNATNKTVTWSTSKNSVATVNSNGHVTAISPGTVTITATTNDGSNLSASCIVTVYNEMKGDVDGNGSINISDVTALIDYLLGGNASAIILINADCDGSEGVNISDVTTLIDFLLSGNWPEQTPVVSSYTVNGVSFDMVEVEGGTFTMGATDEQGSDFNANERPVHEVTLSNYNIGQTEVTQELWQAVMDSNPSNFTGDLQRPVDKVSYYDCLEFIFQLNQLTGKSFRLPTEAEWEFAARGGKLSQGFKYAGSNTVDDVAWLLDNSESTTHPVGTKSPNELGLYDMSGNVFEWCQDWYGSYSDDEQINPTGPTTGTYRVCRGGGWNYNAKYCRVTYRSYHSLTSQYDRIGLRLVLDSDDSPKFRLSETVMKVEVGGSKTVNIVNGGGNYTVLGGTDFVSTSINGNQLTVTGTATGTKSIYVTDATTGAVAILVVIVTERHDEEITVNGVTFKMVTVDGDSFTMGATAEQGNDFNANERPVHQVTLSDYSIGQTEVTQELWVAVMGSNPSNFTGDLQRPVDKVSYYDCQEFISKLNQLTGKSFRLPTEAEWEFAARGGKQSQGYKYAGSNTVDDVAWLLDNSESTTHPVGTKAPNELGLYDMSGNVFEWCQDWYGSYSDDEQINPTGPTTGTYRVCRGGGWNYNAKYCRVSFRSYHSMTSRYDRIGLRLVLDSNEPETPSEDEEFVDLGLPSGILWATKNIGATRPEDYGDYFDLDIDWEDYMCNGMKGVCENRAQSWDGYWPTREQLEELVNECTWTWTTRNAVNGYLVTGPNENSLFLPAAGYYYYGENGFGSLDDEGDYCTYWSGTISYRPHGYDYAFASCLSCSSSEVCMTIDLITNKRPVRPVAYSN